MNNTRTPARFQRITSPRLALEARIVFDAAIAATVTDLLDRSSEQAAYVPPASAQPAREVTVSEPAPPASQAVEQRAVSSEPPPASPPERVEVIFVDPSVKDIQTFFDGRVGEVIYLDASTDGVKQMAGALAGRTNVSAIHILSHGETAQLSLGDAVLDMTDFSGTYAAEFATIKGALAPDADILIYGCDVGAGSQGEAFVNAIAQATGADVAASTDPTGAAALGGDWVLERHTGQIGTPITQIARALADYAYTLGPVSVSFDFSAAPVFTNAGSAGISDVGDSWRFANIRPGIDGIITITANNNGATLLNIDAAGGVNSGSNAYFQPVISGTPSLGSNLEFRLDFVATGTTTAISAGSFIATGADLDGNGAGTASEFARWRNADGFALQSPSDITQAPGSTASNPAFQNLVSVVNGIELETAQLNYSVFYAQPVASVTFQLGVIGSGTALFASRQNAISFQAADIQAYNSPVSVPDVATTPEGAPVTFSILDNDWGGEHGAEGGRVQTPLNQASVDLDTTTADIQTSRTVPGQGTFVYNGNGTVTFTPLGDFNGAVTPISYTVQNTVTASNPVIETSKAASLFVTVSPVNDAPVNAVPIAQSTLEDVTKVLSIANGNAIQISDVDAAGGLMTVTLWAENGAITLSQTTGLTFSTTNPVGTPSTVVSNGTADESMRFTGTVADINAALNGLSFIPAANNSGAGKITLRTEDGGSAGTGGNLTDTDSVTIDFTPVADTVNDSITTPEDTAVTFAPLTSDTFGAGQGYVTAIGKPANGVAVCNADGTVTYTPAADFNGADSYSYTVTTIDPGFRYEYWAVNQPNLDTYAGVFPTGFPGTAADATGWTKGISETDGLRIQEHQNDSIESTIRWSGVVLVEQAGTYTFNLKGDNAARLLIDGVPVMSVGYSQTGGVTATFALTAGVHTFQVEYADVDTPEVVTLTYSGLDTGSVAVNVNDDKHWGSVARTETGTVGITVTPVADIASDTVTTAEDTAVTIAVLGNDSFENPGRVITAVNGLAITAGGAAVAVTNGSVALNPAGELVFTPTPNFSGAVPAFTYTVNSSGVAETANVNVTVTGVNDAPLAQDDTLAPINEDTPLAITPATLLGNDRDPNADPLTITSVQAPAGGTVALVNGNVVFTPTPNYSGPASFTYTISDGNGGTATATVNLTVSPVNDAPLAVNDVASTPINTPIASINVLGNDSDPEGDPLSVTGVAVNPGQGTVTRNPDGTLSFTPTLNFTGTAAIVQSISDGNGGTATATLNVNVATSEPPLPHSPAGGAPPFYVPPPLVGNQPALHVLYSVNDVRVDTGLRADRGIFQTDTATLAELSSEQALLIDALTAPRGFDDLDDSHLRGNGIGTRNALYVQHAVRHEALMPATGLFVQQSVRASQLESLARHVRIESVNPAIAGVGTLLDPFAIGAPSEALAGEPVRAERQPASTPGIDKPSDERTDRQTNRRAADGFATQLRQSASTFRTSPARSETPARPASRGTP